MKWLNYSRKTVELWLNRFEFCFRLLRKVINPHPFCAITRIALNPGMVLRLWLSVMVASSVLRWIVMGFVLVALL